MDIVFGIINSAILIVTAYFIYRSIYSPVDAVKVGRKLNNEEQKDNEKRTLFLTLFALRGNPLHYDFVKRLNEIDIVFEDTETVLTAWHNLYDSLQIKEQVNVQKNWELLRIELLSAMAVSLGYSRIRQTDMIREYYPEGHGTQLEKDMDVQKDWALYLKVNIAMNQMLIERMNNQPGEPTIDP
jgi:hypothetical protein